MEMINSRSLIIAAAELDSVFTTYHGKRTEDALSKIPPLYIRQKQFQALAKAFGLNLKEEPLQEFKLGKFAIDNNVSLALRNQIEQFNLKVRPELAENSEVSETEIRLVFANIFEFYCKLKKLSQEKHINMFEGRSVSAILSMSLKKDFFSEIETQQVKLEEFLMSYFPPTKLEMNILVEKFGFPDVDLKQIDEDFYFS